MDPGYQVYKTETPKTAWGYSSPILKAYRRRLIMKSASNLFKKASRELVFDPDTAIQGFVQNCYVEDNPFASQSVASELVSAYAKDLRIRIEDKDSAGLPTNIASLNRIIGGLRKGNLIVIGGLPGGGKTALGTNILWNLCGANGRKGLMISAEMTKEEITGRLLSLESKVSAEKILTMPGRLTNKEQEQIRESLSDLAGYDFYIDDTPMPSVTQLPHMAYQAKKQLGGLDFIVIDYIQYLQGDLDKNFKSRQEEIAYVTKKIKSLAKSANVPVVAMAQLNREAVKTMPSLSHFQETSQIEKEADIALILAKTSKVSLLSSLGMTPRSDGKPSYLIRVEKNRNGRTGFIEVGFNKEQMFYHEIDAPTIVSYMEEKDEVFG
jgi:replicative DNA helicase